MKQLRAHVERALPSDVRDNIGRSSGLGWNVFFGHVVAWWLPLRERVGFLRALVDRAAVHKVDLRLHWNEGRSVTPSRLPIGNEAILWGGLGGAVVGFFASRIWRADWVLGLLLIGAGIVAGRLFQRLGVRRVCGDPLCRRGLGRAKTCPSCGGDAR